MSILPKVDPDAIAQLHQNLLEDSRFNLNYLVLTVSACLIATFGLISNSPAVIIGAMIVAPLMLPLRGIAFGTLEGELTLVRQSLFSISLGTVVAISLAWTLGRIVGIPEFGSEVLARSQPNLIDLGIAVVAGGLSGFAKVRPQVSDALAGTAIAVALMPPLCVVGLTLSQGIWSYSSGAFLLYLTNLLGIILACMLVFILAGYTDSRKNKPALRWTLFLTGILIIPLGISFWQLVRQSQLQATLRKILVGRTITVGQQVELIKTEVNWTAYPPVVHLDVLAKKTLTPKQVRLVEEFVTQEMGESFILVFQVSNIKEVRSSDRELIENP